LLLCDQGLECVPADVAASKGPSTTSLNVSENAIAYVACVCGGAAWRHTGVYIVAPRSTGANLDKFTCLDTLVVDKNKFEVWPVENLWCSVAPTNSHAVRRCSRWQTSRCCRP